MLLGVLSDMASLQRSQLPSLMPDERRPMHSRVFDTLPFVAVYYPNLLVFVVPLQGLNDDRYLSQ